MPVVMVSQVHPVCVCDEDYRVALSRMGRKLGLSTQQLSRLDVVNSRHADGWQVGQLVLTYQNPARKARLVDTLYVRYYTTAMV